RVDLSESVPSSVSALVVLGPKAAFTDWQLYQMDQFVMRGGSLVVFANPWDVSIQNLSPQGEMSVSQLAKNSSNIGDLLTTWGIKPTGALVAEPETNDVVTVLALIRQGQLTWQTQRQFPYPLLPILNEFDDASPLVRSVASLTLPYTTHFELTPAEGREVTALVSTSPSAVTVSDASFPVEPNAQMGRLATMQGGGPLVVAATSTGTFKSHFAGKEAPADPAPKDAEEGEEKPAETPTDKRLDAGEGRVLVIGSNLGLEPLGREAIFEGFQLTMLTEQNFEIMDTARQWVANLQNWEVRLGQVQHTLSDNLQFLFNVLDWSIQQEGLVEIRSKQYTRRPLEQLDEGEQATMKAVGIGLVPLLFILFGVGRYFMRQARTRRLKV
ncbi:MAG: Gldg family protein, partial [Myxococcota bacterium]|nr:Gldg family protein [Myxococcota bacterium]